MNLTSKTAKIVFVGVFDYAHLVTWNVILANEVEFL